MECPAPGIDAEMRHAHEHEGFRFAQPSLRPVHFRKPSKFNEPGFVGVQVQPKLRKLLSQVTQEAFRLPLMLKADNEFVRIANNDHVSFPRPFAPRLNPQVEHVVQIDVRQQRLW